MTIFLILNAVGLMVLAYLLVQRFRSTRNTGYLVLGIPLVLWSLVWWPLSVLVRSQVDRHALGEPMVWPLSLLADLTTGRILVTITEGSRILQLGLLILGFAWLGRADRHVESTAAEPVLLSTDAHRFPDGV